MTTRHFRGTGSAGRISITVSGEGNSTSYEVSAKEGQFDVHGPLKFTVVGEWEFEELIAAMTAIRGYGGVVEEE